MSAPALSEPPAYEPVTVTDDALAQWFDELADADVEQLRGWLELVAAIQRDWSELVRQLGPRGIVGVPASACAESIEALTERLRRELSQAVLAAVTR